MSSLKVEPVVTESFGIHPDLQGDLVRITLSGTGDMAAAEPLGAYLKAVQEEVSRLSVAIVEFDVRTLYFLNSSCLKAFITFVCNVGIQGLRCKIRFLTDARLGWQRRSLSALQRMSPFVVSIEDA
jgi:hypothetical protein